MKNISCMPNRKKMFICTSNHKGDLRDLFISELSDIYNIVVHISSRIGDIASLDSVDIVLAIIEDINYSYPEAIFEIGLAIGKKIPIVIHDPTVIYPKKVPDGIIPELPYYGNKIWSRMDFYTSKLVKVCKTWPETKLSLSKLKSLIERIDNESDSED